MSLVFFDYEIPVLKSLVKLGGSAKTGDVYPVVEEVMLVQGSLQILDGTPTAISRFIRERVEQTG